MLRDHSFLAVIPARGGSKAVPRKNVRPLAGRPLLHYTLDQAAGVPEIDRTVVSTDDPEIEAAALAVGGEALERPAELATDTAPTEWALLHALDRLEAEGSRFDFIIVLEPTSPFRTPATIRRCMARIVDTGAPSLMTVVETRDNLGRLEGGRFRPLVPGAPRRRQAREPFYVESSTVYVACVDFLRQTGSLVAEDWVAEIVSNEEAVDINTLIDFATAEALMQAATPRRGKS
jgi:N-acylneuraminate cytidylyltransferase